MTKKNGVALCASFTRSRRATGILGYDGEQGLDLIGPADTFTAADQCC